MTNKVTPYEIMSIHWT